MSARILVVDDILPNVKLLEAKLKAEYYDVLTATSGPEALEIAEKEKPDVVLLDIMMPGMDGFEVCERLKATPATVHIPVVMVTALTDATDRVRGLEAGADDFLSKPVNDTALMARVRSLVRLKMIVDEWQVREKAANQLGAMDSDKTIMAESVENAHILVVEDNQMESSKMVETMERDNAKVVAVRQGEDAMGEAQFKDFDLIVVSLNMVNEDGLRLCSFFRSNERSRAVPILMVGEEQDMPRIARGLEIGAHDYILRPLDRNEFIARVRTQIRRKRYQDRLKTNYELSLSMALTDELTGLYNRRYLMVHLEKILAKHEIDKKPVGILMLDIDHFKPFNDTYGHDIGDFVLKTFSERVNKGLRSLDMVARMGGEEFVAILPDATQEVAIMVAERLRRMIGDKVFECDQVEGGELSVTVSIGGFVLTETGIDPNRALKEADDALYEAKEGGRNCCVFKGIGKIDPASVPQRRPKNEEGGDNGETGAEGDTAPPPQATGNADTAAAAPGPATPQQPARTPSPADSGFFDEPDEDEAPQAQKPAITDEKHPTPIAAPPPPSPGKTTIIPDDGFFVDPSLTDPMGSSPAPQQAAPPVPPQPAQTAQPAPPPQQPPQPEQTAQPAPPPQQPPQPQQTAQPAPPPQQPPQPEQTAQPAPPPQQPPQPQQTAQPAPPPQQPPQPQQTAQPAPPPQQPPRTEEENKKEEEDSENTHGSTSAAGS